MDPYKRVGRPTWSSDKPIEGLNISDETKRLLSQEHGCLYFSDYFRTLRTEPALFLRMDIQDFKIPEGAKFLKAFVDMSAWPNKQKKTVVLICSLEERLQYSDWLTNVLCSGVKWQER
jgi:hypothetical protein